MSDQTKQALEFIGKQIRELKIIQPHLLEAVNAILAKEQFYKWKKQVVTQVGEQLGTGYRKRLSKDWLETAFAGADMYDELSDDIEMCLRHLYQLSHEIETGGLQGQDEIPST
ncbi:MAG: hypothetical protein OXF97_10910 [Nitrospira sp.]|nr:hypothetical protein [Nitrospira sp.]MCY3956110.1 hypothetical protein [Nitrospira sp.]MCY4132759.1 hypothetical protein [Nitrospira sp.]